jgi:hypothetical protein
MRSNLCDASVPDSLDEWTRGLHLCPTRRSPRSTGSFLCPPSNPKKQPRLDRPPQLHLDQIQATRQPGKIPGRRLRRSSTPPTEGGASTAWPCPSHADCLSTTAHQTRGPTANTSRSTRMPGSVTSRNKPSLDAQALGLLWLGVEGTDLRSEMKLICASSCAPYQPYQLPPLERAPMNQRIAPMIRITKITWMSAPTTL